MFISVFRQNIQVHLYPSQGGSEKSTLTKRGVISGGKGSDEAQLFCYFLKSISLGKPSKKKEKKCGICHLCPDKSQPGREMEKKERKNISDS